MISLITNGGNMLAIYLAGKSSPVILKSARFGSKLITGLDSSGETRKIKYDQVKEIRFPGGTIKK